MTEEIKTRQTAEGTRSVVRSGLRAGTVGASLPCGSVYTKNVMIDEYRRMFAAASHLLFSGFVPVALQAKIKVVGGLLAQREMREWDS